MDTNNQSSTNAETETDSGNIAAAIQRMTAAMKSILAGEKPAENLKPGLVPVSEITPAPENDNIYGALSPNDPEVWQLAKSIQEHGIREPLLISTDGYIISGHRRRYAAMLAKLGQVPVLVHPVSRSENPDEFKRLLVEMNTQRIKSAQVQLRETLVKIDPEAAHQQIINDRKQKDLDREDCDLSVIDPASDGRRNKISKAKLPFLDAVKKILDDHRQYWPMSDRQIHYRLLGPNAPLRHASKPDSTYRNDKKSYKDLTDLLTRARIEGYIPFSAIDDETRPMERNNAYWNAPDYLRSQFAYFLTTFWRDRQQSQDHDIVLITEKLTVHSILNVVAREYCIPVGCTRGQSALALKYKIVTHYRRSERDKLILLVVSDLDPAGDAIAEDWVKSLRRDFRIEKVEAYKVALTIEQVEQYNLTPSMEAKEASATYQAYVDLYGITDAYELEALDPADLKKILEDAIDKVLDLEAYNAELAAEENDSAQILAVKEQAWAFFNSLQLD
jgi:hypothetical protein